MKLNIPELNHYIVGGLALMLVTPPMMEVFPFTNYMTINFVIFAVVWILAYIIIDQLLHVVIKHEKISILR